MIDTVCIKLKHTEFRVRKPEIFTPNFNIDTNTSNFTNKDGRVKTYQKYTLNRSARSGNSSYYKPVLTGYYRLEDGDINYYLHIQFSAPKLLYGNSLKETSNSSFTPTVLAIKERLQRMGIDTTEKALEESLVTNIHFAKNIPLPEPLTVREVNQELHKANLGKRMRVKYRDYNENGESLYFYTKVHNIVFYDKIKEIENSKPASFEECKTDYDRELLELYKGRQILRFEIRFTDHRTIKKLIGNITNKNVEYVTFKEVFSENIAQKALLKDWNNLMDKSDNQLALKFDTPDEDILDTLIRNFRGKKQGAHSMNNLLIQFALHTIVNQLGTKHLHSKIEYVWTDKTCKKRLQKRIDETAEALKEIPIKKSIQLISDELNSFKRYDPNNELNLG